MGKGADKLRYENARHTLDSISDHKAKAAAVTIPTSPPSDEKEAEASKTSTPLLPAIPGETSFEVKDPVPAFGTTTARPTGPTQADFDGFRIKVVLTLLATGLGIVGLAATFADKAEDRAVRRADDMRVQIEREDTRQAAQIAELEHRIVVLEEQLQRLVVALKVKRVIAPE